MGQTDVPLEERILRSGAELMTPARLANTNATIGWVSVNPSSEQEVIQSKGAKAT